MGLIVTPEQYERTRFPETGARLNRRHPFAKYVAGLFLPDALGRLVDVLDQTKSTGNSLPVVGRRGRASEFDLRDARFAHKTRYAIVSSGVTFLACMEVDAFTNYAHVVAKQSTSTTHCPYEFRLGYGATDAELTVVRASGSSFRVWRANSGAGIPTPPAGRPTVCGFSVADNLCQTAPTFVVDGATWTAIDGGGGGTGSVTDVGAEMMFGYRPDAATRLDGRIYGAVLLNTGVSARVLAELSQQLQNFFA